MSTQTRKLLRQAIADDERWIARAKALIVDDGADYSSIEEDIAFAQRQVDRMRALL